MNQEVLQLDLQGTEVVTPHPEPNVVTFITCWRWVDQGEDDERPVQHLDETKIWYCEYAEFDGLYCHGCPEDEGFCMKLTPQTEKVAKKMIQLSLSREG